MYIQYMFQYLPTTIADVFGILNVLCPPRILLTTDHTLAARELPAVQLVVHMSLGKEKRGTLSLKKGTFHGKTT